ncbi:diacylglycerol/lipid kinase family protein [Capillimicrobium parvum]|uniref:diacylglycerol/lipid kinase family protein n=1 Tax=Capillimicrobium parvum TaxID=2884022 RepID=UPI00216B02C0|nr:diacylglycerol kinase family protein [Capillimicrobium parvum]
MRVALIANRASGTGTDAEDIAARLRAGGAEVTPFDLGDVASATRVDPERLVVAGGDGSVGIVAELASRTGAPMAVVPTGTANDFARELDLPSDLDGACALAARPDARTVTLQLARAGERPFVNAAACGLSVVAARRAKPLKPKLGALAYALGALRAGLTGRPIAVRVEDASGRTVFDGRAWQAIVGATGAFGGGSGIEEADPRDRLLDLVVVTARSRIALVRRAFGLRTGRIARQPGVVHARSTELRVLAPPGTRWNVDGEIGELNPSLFANRGEDYAVVVP